MTGIEFGLREEPSVRFSKPDWETIAAGVGEGSRDVIYPRWVEVARVWAEDLRAALGDGHEVRETPNFIVVAPSGYESLPRLLAFLEGCFRCIGEFLPYTNPHLLMGKCFVILFASVDDFYEYVAAYIPDDGEYGMMGGVYLNEGYGHFALPYDDMGHYEAIVGHELTHAFLSQFDLPLWLDEAITAESEHRITGQNPYVLDRETLKRHRGYWNQDKIDAFWRGDSYFSPDEGQELSYHLCRYILAALPANVGSQAMGDFLAVASREDAGFCAAEEIFGVNLQHVVDGLLEDDAPGGRIDEDD